MIGWFVLIACSAAVVGYQSGAPPTACQSLVPKHPGGTPQAFPSPYEISAGVPRLVQGNSLRLVLASPQGVPFQGFVIQARNPLAPTEPLGTFTVLPALSKAISCGQGRENTITHDSKVPKTALEFEWQSPSDYIGTVVFNGTMLQDYATYWVGAHSGGVQVVKRSLADNGGQSAGISTTRRPVTTTAPPTLRPETGVQLATGRAPIYDGCDSKLCFGLPDKCIDNGDCTAFVSVLVKGDIYEFEMRAKNAAYISLGLSRDDKMGADSVVECPVTNGNDVGIHASWNTANVKANVRILSSAENNGVHLLDKSYVDGYVYCRFTRDAMTTVEGSTFDLVNQPYYLLLAAGSEVTPEKISYHDVIRGSSSEAVYLSVGGMLSGASKLLLRLHSSFMIAAWIGATSIGTLLARYFKKTWVGRQTCGKDQWFAWHQFLMVLTWCLTIVGFVLIFVELKAWSAEDNPHAILGTVTTGLAFIQPFMAFLRPAPSSHRRPLFNWMHWLVGNAAHILAIVTIFFATRLAKAEVPSWMDWILVGYVAFHVAMHLIFSIVGCASEKNSVKRVNTFPMKEMSSSRNPLQSAHMSQDAPHSGVRKFLFGVYVFVILLVTIALVVISALAPIEESFSKLQKIILPNSN